MLPASIERSPNAPRLDREKPQHAVRVPIASIARRPQLERLVCLVRHTPGSPSPGGPTGRCPGHRPGHSRREPCCALGPLAVCRELKTGKKLWNTACRMPGRPRHSGGTLVMYDDLVLFTAAARNHARNPDTHARSAGPHLPGPIAACTGSRGQRSARLLQ